MTTLKQTYFSNTHIGKCVELPAQNGEGLQGHLVLAGPVGVQNLVLHQAATGQTVHWEPLPFTVKFDYCTTLVGPVSL
jgi:hypothetical protein